MPQRFLKPGIISSKKWDSCSWTAQSFYIRLLTLVDDFGRYEAEPVLLRSQCFPLREDLRTDQVQKLMLEIQANQLAHFYKLDGKVYIQLTNWTETPRSQRSRYPSFDKQTCEQMFTDENICEHLQTNVPLPRPRPRTRQIVNESSIHTSAGNGKQTLATSSSCLASEEEIKTFCLSNGLLESDGAYLFDKWEGNGWTNDGRPIRNWKRTILSWKTAKFLPSQKTVNAPVSKSLTFSQKATLNTLDAVERFGNDKK